MKRHPVFDKYLISEDGVVVREDNGRILQYDLTKEGYYRVTLFQDVGSRTKQPVHRLVAETYIPKIEGKDFVNHKDMDKTNNHVSNLEWVTARENTLHAWKETGGWALLGEDKGNAVLTNDEVHDLCRKMEQGYRNIDIHKETGIAQHLISDIRQKHAWRHISDNYDIKPSMGRMTSQDTVVKIAEKLQNGERMSKIADDVGVTYGVVKNIRNRKHYSDITKDYKF